MQPGRTVGIFVAGVAFAVAMLGAGIVSAYLTEYGATRFILAILALAAGCVVAVALYALALRSCKTRRRSVAASSVVVLALAVPLASLVYPGRITYSRFGLTVYGLVPVPVLDIAIGPSGFLWFRDKSHYVSLGEVQKVLAPEVEVVLIGIGWDSAVEVDPAILAIQGPEIRVLPTPSAFASFNQCVSEGRKAVLIAHSTC